MSRMPSWMNASPVATSGMPSWMNAQPYQPETQFDRRAAYDPDVYNAMSRAEQESFNNWYNGLSDAGKDYAKADPQTRKTMNRQLAADLRATNDALAATQSLPGQVLMGVQQVPIIGQALNRAAQGALDTVSAAQSLTARATGLASEAMGRSTAPAKTMIEQINRDNKAREKFLQLIEEGEQTNEILGDRGSRIFNSVARSVPKIAGIASSAGGAAVLATVTGETFDQALHDADEQGIENRLAYAGSKAAIEGGVTAVFGAVGKAMGVRTLEESLTPGGRNAVSWFLRKSGMDKKLAELSKFTKFPGSGLTAEAAEEATVSALQQVVDKIATGKQFDGGEIFEAAVAGALGAGAVKSAQGYQQARDQFKKYFSQPRVEQTVSAIASAENFTKQLTLFEEMKADGKAPEIKPDAEPEQRKAEIERAQLAVRQAVLGGVEAVDADIKNPLTQITLPFEEDGSLSSEELLSKLTSSKKPVGQAEFEKLTGIKKSSQLFRETFVETLKGSVNRQQEQRQQGMEAQQEQPAPASGLWYDGYTPLNRISTSPFKFSKPAKAAAKPAAQVAAQPESVVSPATTEIGQEITDEDYAPADDDLGFLDELADAELEDMINEEALVEDAPAQEQVTSAPQGNTENVTVREESAPAQDQRTPADVAKSAAKRNFKFFSDHDLDLLTQDKLGAAQFARITGLPGTNAEFRKTFMDQIRELREQGPAREGWPTKELKVESSGKTTTKREKMFIRETMGWANRTEHGDSVRITSIHPTTEALYNSLVTLSNRFPEGHKYFPLTQAARISLETGKASARSNGAPDDGVDAAYWAAQVFRIGHHDAYEKLMDGIAADPLLADAADQFREAIRAVKGEDAMQEEQAPAPPKAKRAPKAAQPKVAQPKAAPPKVVAPPPDQAKAKQAGKMPEEFPMDSFIVALRRLDGDNTPLKRVALEDLHREWVNDNWDVPLEDFKQAILKKGQNKGVVYDDTRDVVNRAPTLRQYERSILESDPEWARKEYEKLRIQDRETAIAEKRLTDEFPSISISEAVKRVGGGNLKSIKDVHREWVKANWDVPFEEFEKDVARRGPAFGIKYDAEAKKIDRKKTTAAVKRFLEEEMKEEAEPGEEGFVADESGALRITPQQQADLAERGQNLVAATKLWIKQNFRAAGLRNEALDRLNSQRLGSVAEQVKQSEFLAKDLEDALGRAYGGRLKMTKAQLADVDNALKGLPNHQPISVMEALVPLRQHINQLSRTLIDLGVIDEAQHLALEERDGMYITRNYQKFDDKNWMKRVKSNEDLMRRARGWLASEYPQDTPMQREWRLNALIDQDSAAARDDNFPGGNLDGKFMDLLKTRKDLPGVVRELFGEYRDPFVNYTNSVAKMARLVSEKQFAQQAAQIGLAQGWLATPETARPEQMREISARNHPNISELSGLYATPEIAMALNDIMDPKMEAHWYRTAVKLSGYAKEAKTVFSVGTHFVNFFGNPMFALASGDLSGSAITNAGQIARAVKTMMTDRGDAGTRKFVEKLTKLRVLDGSLTVGEIQSYSDSMGKLWGDESLAADDPWFGAKSLKRGWDAFRDKAQRAYQAEDAIWKINGFLQKQKYYARLHPNATQDQIDQMAADDVIAHYPTYHRANAATRAISRFPLIADFATFQAEMVRTTKNAVVTSMREMQSNNPIEREMGQKRMIGLIGGSIAVPALSAISQAVAGVSDEEEEALRKFVAPWSERGFFLFFGRGEDGSYLIQDLSRFDPRSVLTKAAGSLMRGDAAGVIDELNNPMGESILFGKLASWWRNRNPEGTPVYDEDTDLQRQTAQTLKHFMEAFTPGALDQAGRIAKAFAGETSRGGKDYKVGQELLATFGARSETVDVRQAMEFRNGDMTKRVRNLEKGAMREAMSRGTAKLGIIMGELEAFNGYRDRAIMEWHDLYKAATVLGMPTSEIGRHISDTAGKDVAREVISGRPQVYAPSANAVQTIRERQASARDGVDRIGAMREVITELRRKKQERLQNEAQ